LLAYPAGGTIRPLPQLPTPKPRRWGLSAWRGAQLIAPGEAAAGCADEVNPTTSGGKFRRVGALSGPTPDRRRQLWRTHRPGLQSGLFDGTMNYRLPGRIPRWSAPAGAGSAAAAGLPSPPTAPGSRRSRARVEEGAGLVRPGDQPLPAQPALTAMTPPGPACARRRREAWPLAPAATCSCCRVRPASITATRDGPPRWWALNPAARRPCHGPAFPWGAAPPLRRCWPG